MLRRHYENGWNAAQVKLALAQPGLGAVGIKSPVKAPGLPGAAKLPQLGAPAMPSASGAPPVSGGNNLGLAAAKVAFNAGLGSSNASDGAGSVAGDPADTGRRQRSVIDRTFQANEDNFATSSMPLPGDRVSP